MKTITFFNNKGGVGKTTSVINIAYEMFRAGKKVVVIDVDGQQNTSRFFVDIDTPYGTVEKTLITGAEPIIKPTRYSNIGVITAGNTLNSGIQEFLSLSENVQSEHVQALINSIDCDYVLFDLPPALNKITNRILSVSNKVYVPIELGSFAIQGITNAYLLSDAASVLIPFSNRGYYTETGISYGMNKITNSVIVLDRTDEMNSNGFTLGCSGSGKSMFTKSEIIDVLMKYPNDEIIVVDPDNEYAPLVKEFDGEIFKLSPSSSTTLNLFDTDLSYAEEGVNAISMKSEFIMSVVEIAKGIKLSSNEKSIIDRCVKNVYQPFVQSSGNKDYIPTLEDFYNELKAQPEQEASDVAIALELYVKGSFSNFAGVTNIDIKKKFLVMDIMEMGEQLAAVGLHVILEFLWQRVISNKQRGIRTWVWIDEFSVMFSDGSERSGDFFAKVYKRIRKHGGVITGITQNITEVIASKQAQTMLQNTEFVVLLQQAKHDLDTLIDLFELSPSQAMYLKSGEKGSGLIICGKKVIPFEKKIPQDNLIYKICSTNFKEVQKEYQTEMKND